MRNAVVLRQIVAVAIVTAIGVAILATAIPDAGQTLIAAGFVVTLGMALFLTTRARRVSARREERFHPVEPEPHRAERKPLHA
jgi:hypothetical protein